MTTITTEAVAIVEYASYYMPQFWNSELGVLTALGLLIALVAFFMVLQVVGINIYGWFNRIITTWKLVIPVLTVILLLSLYFHPSYVTGKLPGGFAPYGYSALFTGMISSGIVWAYQGFRQGLEYAGEGKNPQRDVPLGVISALLVTILLYVLVQVAFIGAINWSAAGVNLGDWKDLASKWQAHPFVSELMASGIPLLMGFAIILLVDAVVSPAGTLAVYVGTAGRNLYGMSRTGYVPGVFSKIHGRFRTPWIAIIVAAAVGIAFLAPFPTWYAIMSYSVTVTLYGYLMVGVTNHVLRNVAPELNRPFKTPAWYLFYPLSFIVASMLIYWSGWPYVNAAVLTALVGLPLLFLGPYRADVGLSRRESIYLAAAYWASISLAILSWYLNWLGVFSALSAYLPFIVYWSTISLIQILTLIYLWYRTRHPDIKGASWIILFNILIGVVSYIGSLGPLSKPLIPYPWDYAAWAALSLIVYIVAVKVGYRTRDLERTIREGLPSE